MESLPRIPVERFHPLRGALSFYRAEDGAQVNIDIPLAPFDSGLAQDDQPVETVFDLVLCLPVGSINELDGREFTPQPDDCDSTIYLGCAHNPVHVHAVRFRRITDKEFHVACRLACDFAFERVGEPAVATLETELGVDFDGSPR